MLNVQPEADAEMEGLLAVVEHLNTGVVLSEALSLALRQPGSSLTWGGLLAFCKPEFWISSYTSWGIRYMRPLILQCLCFFHSWRDWSYLLEKHPLNFPDPECLNAHRWQLNMFFLVLNLRNPLLGLASW